MKEKIMYWLRWLAVLPGSLLAIIIISFPLRWILYFTLTPIISPYPELPERILFPFVAAITFIWAGAYIAPEHKFKTAVVLFGILMFSLGGFVFLTLTDSSWKGYQFYMQGGGIGSIMSALGAIFGLFYPMLRKIKSPIKSGSSKDIKIF